MGVKGYNKGMRKKHPELYRSAKLSVFAGHRVGIDISIWFYAFKAVCTKQALSEINVELEQLDEDVVLSYWLQKFHDQIMMFIESDILPIPVFDGPHHRLKENTKDNRKAELKKKQDLMKELQMQIVDGRHEKQTLVDLEAVIRNTVEIKPKEIQFLKQMFDEMGIRYIQADTEAECVCAYLCRMGYVSAVVTKDSDIFAYRCPIVITDVERKTRLGKPMHRCTYVIFEDVLKVTNMSEEEFVDFCVLSGTDYNRNLGVIQEGKEKPYSIAFARAYDFVSKHGGMQKVLEMLNKKGYVAPYDVCCDLIESYGAMTKDFFEDLIENEKIDLEGIMNPAILEEIKSYFLKDPVVNLTEELIFFMNGDLEACFDEIFKGPNKYKMIERADEIKKTLLEFETRFVELQKYELVIVE